MQGFTDAILSESLVRGFAYGIVPVEAGVGLLGMVVWKTRGPLVAGQAPRPRAVKQDGPATRLGTQIIDVGLYTGRFPERPHNGFAVDSATEEARQLPGTLHTSRQNGSSSSAREALV